MATYDTLAYGKLWRDRRGRFVQATQGAREALRRDAARLARGAMEQLIYSKPEDVGADGRPLWTRTRELINAETAHLGSEGEVILSNDTIYAHRRHEANRPGFPFHVNASNPDRTAHWRDSITDSLRDLQLRHTESAVLRALGALAALTTSAGPASGSGGGGGGGGGGGAPVPVRRPPGKKNQRLFPARFPKGKR